MSSRRFHRSRREFLKSSLTTLGYLAVATGPGALARRAFAGLENRRHLITIQGMGGWDTYWFHAYFPKDHAKLSGNDVTLKNPQSVTIDAYTQLYTERFTGAPLIHPTKRDHKMGLGMKKLFGDAEGTRLLSDDVLIIKGMAKEFDHGIGNKLILQGGLSSYALSFSALIARGIAAKDYLRPIHYAMLTGTPDEFNANWAMNTGAAVPTNIASYAGLQTLTRPSPGDFSAVSDRDRVNDTIKRLAMTVGAKQFKQKSSKSIYENFTSAFTGAVTVGGTNLTERLSFRYVWKTYVLRAMAAVESVYEADFLNQIPLMRTDGQEFSKIDFEAVGARGDISAARAQVQPLPGIAFKDVEAHEGGVAGKVMTPQAATDLRAGLSDFLALRGRWGWFDVVINTAFDYAVADYLVRYDLSAVVDIRTPTGDCHTGMDVHVVQNMIGFACYRNLLDNLKGKLHDYDPSKNLLSKTTVVMFTELDRTAGMQLPPSGPGLVRKGTNHAPTASCLMAGYGVQGGRVIGDMRTGPAGLYSSFANEYLEPLPINPTTGVPDPNGIVFNTRALLPTMMAMFGLEVPANQISELSAVPAVLKG